MSARSRGPYYVAVAGAALVVLSACTSTTSGSGVNTSAAAASTSTTTSSPAPSTSAVSTSASVTATQVVHPVPSQPIRSATVSDGAVSYKIDVWAERADTKCSTHAYGTPVITYLTAHPCRGMSRLIATTTVGGKRVGFSQITVAFLGGPPASYTYAVDFRKLVLADGTGSVNDLLREGYRLPSGPTSIPSSEAFSATGEDAVATIYDAWYLDGPTPDNDPPLMKLLQDIFLQF